MFADYAANQTTDATLEKYYGKYPGVVIDDSGNSTYPLTEDERKRGELWVRVPGILEELPDDNSPDGADPQGLEVIAKPCFPPGFFYVPEPGAHVWVEFAAGDINTPIWSGVWYPSNAIPPTVADSTPTRAQKVIRTGSGHVVQIDDTGNEEKIVIMHKGSSFMSIDKDSNVLIHNQKGTISLNAKEGNIQIADEHQNSVTLQESGIIIQRKANAGVYLHDDLVRIIAKDVVLVGTVNIGQGDDPSAFASALAADEALTLMLNLFTKHTHATALGPSGPPVPTVNALIPGTGVASSLRIKMK